MASSINAESLAQAMETAFITVWPGVMDGQPAPAMNPQMHMMFLAIAQGVVNHLKANPDAFKVTVTETGSGNYTGTVTSIV
jgi:hypothetical protein